MLRAEPGDPTMTTQPLDLVIKNVRVVRPRQPAVDLLDLGVRDGRFARIAPGIPASDAREVFDGHHLLGFPGVVDAHTHVGIYAPLSSDAESESKAAASGGVTAMLTYFRTGQYYLNRGGPYAEFFPEVLRLSDGHYWVDYGYHLAPIEASHVGEMEALAIEHGVPSFKIFMFYGDYGLHGKADRRDQRNFLMLGEDERYDLAHFEFVMRGAAGVQARHPSLADHVSVSLHCEIADILNAYTRLVLEQDPSLLVSAPTAPPAPRTRRGSASGSRRTSPTKPGAAREPPAPPRPGRPSRRPSECAPPCPMSTFGARSRRGTSSLDHDTSAGARAKVNPPIRSREDVEFLWQALVLDPKVDWVVSDHACCATETKLGPGHSEDIWLAKAGFGGTEYLLSGVFSEGSRRGLSPAHVAELVSWNPARRFGLAGKGDIAPGYLMPTSCSSIPPGPSRCGPSTRRRRRGTRPSRVWSSGAR